MSGRLKSGLRMERRQLGLGALALAAPLLLANSPLIAQQTAPQQVGTHGPTMTQDSLPLFRIRIDSLRGVLDRAPGPSPQSVQALAMMEDLLRAAAMAGGGQASKLFV